MPGAATGLRKKRAKPPAPETSGGQTHAAVVAFLRDLDHPLKREIELLRRIIIGTSVDIREEIKWKAPSFRTTEHFATFNLHSRNSIRLILHRGARTRKGAASTPKIADPAGLLQWLATDRCLMTFDTAAQIRGRAAAVRAILTQWIRPAPPDPRA